MAAKKPVTRTLKNSGEKVTYHPDGVRQIVNPGSLAATLAATEEVDRESDSQLSDQRLAAVEHKRDSLSSGDSVPDDKRPV